MKDNQMSSSLENRPRLYMLAGLPGAGKSTEAVRLRERCRAEGRNAEIISSDTIRKLLYGDESIQGDNNEVFSRMGRAVKSTLLNGDIVIYDATNISEKRRRAFLKTIERINYEKICLIFASPIRNCIERNQSRYRIVPEEVIIRMYRQWTTPSYEEGWDKIGLFYPDDMAGCLGDPEDFVESLMDYEQDNPHHLETLGWHMKAARAIIEEKFGVSHDSNLATAALLHDCGKPFTKAFRDGKGRITDIAHYYDHEHVGAYDSLFFDYKWDQPADPDGNDPNGDDPNGDSPHSPCENADNGDSPHSPCKNTTGGDSPHSSDHTDDILEISFMIGHHMLPFAWKNPISGMKARAKADERYDAETIKKIEMLHYADTQAKRSLLK